ncbi:hypothetical protein J2Z83_003746 [Virgibacillus natechei]|uniref:Uncharacterized protein n=1 Tax=Virgibacillus natechei TaxID=1216297 RepID=A0ABS4IL09_9BACI|nr:hypothetical protein [Virgibacillus natechei]MBP1971595.1 hypothetical protein [Virgibacillus natechei]UZD13074.1 hypothetical protein OLD84_00395 [Virgibacillus natechei]
MDDLKIDCTYEIIIETDEYILYRVSWVILGKHGEQWVTEYKD